MHADTDIAAQLLRAALRRRAPLWLAAMLPWCLLLSAPGVAVWALWAAWDFRRLRARVQRDWTHWLDAALPALEDSSALLAHAPSQIAQLQRRRLLRRAAATLTSGEMGRIVRIRTGFGLRWLALSVVAALAWWGWQSDRAGDPAVSNLMAKLAAANSEIVVRIVPPKYTAVAAFEAAPRDLQVPQHSEVQWCLKDPQPLDTPIELSDGQSLKIGYECARWSAAESVFWRWRGVRYKLLVVPDQEPRIGIAAPKEMVQVLAADAKSATISLEVRDDYMVRRASLHMTLARGSGENIRFSDREMPLPASTDPKLRSWSKQWSLADLGMEPGDELYFFVRASDNAERPHVVQSPTYTLRLPGPVEQDTESSALPMLVKPENLRSQRQIIIDTEQLVADMKAAPKIDAAVIRARSETIARDQAQLRRRYGQFLGEQSSLFGGDEHEAEGGVAQDIVAQYGHAHDESENATLFDEATKVVLRRALSAMWDAEKALRAIAPKPALPSEYKALEAIKELQQADRIYLHKTAFAAPAIKEEKRMTGDVVGAKSYRREQGGADQPIPAELRELLQALASDSALPALWSRTAHDWIRTRITNDEQRLDAQRAVQDVADGCAQCRPVLRAWLRGAIGGAPVLLQAAPAANTPFVQAWRKGSKP
ncbi:MAG: hypothetical protein Q8R69_13495 [Telluria sp.]|nr:hypothetical protein [Telluria sp.]